MRRGVRKAVRGRLDASRLLAELLAAVFGVGRRRRYGPATTVLLGIWRARIVAECGGLENRYRETYRGFESLALRNRCRYHNACMIGTVAGMSTNLRLSPDAEVALRDAARKSGRSQQDLLREAVDRYLGLSRESGTRDRAVAAGVVRPPSPFRDTKPAVRLRRGVSSLGLLDRDEDR
jgi:hypothetical protein